jgi:hypothetical protein
MGSRTGGVQATSHLIALELATRADLGVTLGAVLSVSRGIRQIGMVLCARLTCGTINRGTDCGGNSWRNCGSYFGDQGGIKCYGKGLQGTSYGSGDRL